MLLAAFLFVLPVANIPTNHVRNLMVTTTCDETLYKELCKSVLGTAPARDMRSLAKSALHELSSIGVEIQKKIIKAEKEDESIEEPLKECSEIYDDAMNEIQDTIKSLASRNYNDVRMSVSALMNAGSSCEDIFSESETLSPLTELNIKFSQFCSVVSKITDLMPSDGYKAARV